MTNTKKNFLQAYNVEYSGAFLYVSMCFTHQNHKYVIVMGIITITTTCILPCRISFWKPAQL